MYTVQVMKISFVIPAYNEEVLLGHCLESVQHALATGTYDAEVIVVDNASTDKTGAIARSFPFVKVVEEHQKGLTFARQAGYAVATGDIIANIDSDTILPPEWLPTVLEEFESSDTLVALSGPYIYYDLSIFDRGLVKLFYIMGYVLHLFNSLLGAGSMLQGGNFILRTSALKEIGGFDTSIEFYGEDTDIARRIIKIGRVKWSFALPMYTSGRRLKKEGITRMAWKYTLNHLSILYFNKPFTTKHIDIRG